MPKIADFKTYEEADQAFRNSAAFKAIPTQPARDASMLEFRQKFDATHPRTIEPPAPTAPVEGAPDLMGRINEAAGAATDSAVQKLDPKGRVGDALPLMKLPGAIVRGVLPDSNIQAGIDAAMLATGLGPVKKGMEAAQAVTKGLPPTARAIGRFASRFAPSAIGGAIGGATTGDPGKGAAKGAAEQLSGEVASGIFQRGKAAIQGDDLSRIGGWIEKNLPAKVGTKIEDFDKAFRGGSLVRDVGAALEKTNTQIGDKILESADASAAKPVFGSRKVAYGAPKTDTPYGSEIVDTKGGASGPTRIQNGRIHVELPQVVAQKEGINTVDGSLQDINDKITQVSNMGWDMHGDPTTRETGRAMRSAAHQMVEDVADALNAHEAGLGDKWRNARQQFASAKVLTRVLQEPGVIDRRSGMLDMEKLQALTSEAGMSGYREDLNRALGDKAGSFLDTAFRNAAPVKSDLKGQFPIGRAHATTAKVGFPVHMPKLARHVGDVPYDLGRGKALGAVLTLGPYKFAQTLNHLINGEQPPPEGTP